MLSEIKNSIQVTVIDIADNDTLMNQYGTRIPVLKRDDTQLELGWPFNLNDLQKFIS
jgi:hypothetical protein